MCTLVWQRYQLPLLSQWCAHHCHTNVNIAITALSVVSATSVHSNVTALTATALGQHACSGSDNAEITVCTLLWQRWQRTVLRQRYQLPLLSQWCAHRCHTVEHRYYSAVSCHRCYSPVSCHHFHTSVHSNRCCSVVSLHHWHTNVAVIAATVLRPQL